MEFLRRLTRRWWMMLLLGVVIGLGAGLPLGGSVWPDDLRGTAGPPQYIDVETGETFSVSGGESTTPWQLHSYPTYFLEFEGENPTGTFNFKVVGDNMGWIVLSNEQTAKVFGVRVLPPWEPIPGDHTQ